MNILTVRLPDATAARLKDLARRRGMSVNKLFEEMSVQAIAAFDAETRFEPRWKPRKSMMGEDDTSQTRSKIQAGQPRL